MSAPLHDNLRDSVGQALSDKLAEMTTDGAEPDWCDSRNVDELADAALVAITASAVTTDDIWPIARILVRDGKPVESTMYAPGLPDGLHDVFPVPVALPHQETTHGVLAEVFEALDDGDGNGPGHRHSLPGIWDDDNSPELAGSPCEWCATWARFKTIAAKPGAPG